MDLDLGCVPAASQALVLASLQGLCMPCRTSWRQPRRWAVTWTITDLPSAGQTSRYQALRLPALAACQVHTCQTMPG